MFAELRRLTTIYVDKQNDIAKNPRLPDARYRFNDNPGVFSVYDGWGTRRAVGIKLKGGEFHVLRDVPEPPAFVATLELTNVGECRFRVGEELLQPWQLLRRALEPLFYPLPE